MIHDGSRAALWKLSSNHQQVAELAKSVSGLERELRELKSQMTRIGEVIERIAVSSRPEDTSSSGDQIFPTFSRGKAASERLRLKSAEQVLS